MKCVCRIKGPSSLFKTKKSSLFHCHDTATDTATTNDRQYIQMQWSLHGLPTRKDKKKVQGVPQSQTAALHTHQEEIDRTKQAQIEQRYEKH